jgi:hypothetical protein
MGVSVRGQRAWAAWFVIATIAASCALPGYEVGESSSSTTATASNGSGGGSQTSSSTGTGGAGQGGEGGKGGAGGEGGTAGAGGFSPPECPAAPPPPEAKCAWPQFKCFYPSTADGMSCCDDEYKCLGNDPSTAVWTFIGQANCPPMGCPQECFPECPAQPPPAGCRCRAEQAACIYNTCGAAKMVQHYECSPPDPGVIRHWFHKAPACCGGPNDPPCPTCTTAKDTDGNDVSFCN